MQRRDLLAAAGGLTGGLLPSILRAQAAPAELAREMTRPEIPFGVQAGDALADRAVVWTRAERPTRMWVDWSTTASFTNVQRVPGPYLTETSDYTGRIDLQNLPPGQDIFYRVQLQDLRNQRLLSEPVAGHLRLPAPASAPRNVRFIWSADTAGQGFGINEAWGGMKIYEQIRKLNPDFFLHSGDTIYADGPIQRELKTVEGGVWTNVVTQEVSKVAETVEEFRGRYRYNLLDANVRRMNAEVAQIWQWDDHEVVNNWSGSLSLVADGRYTEKSVPVLVARAAQAFHDYAPMRPQAEASRVYRYLPQGPLLDVFVLDMRSYRGPNTHNMQSEENDESAFLGRPQVAWLLDGLKHSRAVWKVIAADQPIGLDIGDGKDLEGRPRWEAVSNGDPGAPAGRELEIARLLREIKRAGIQNIVWVTGDVHYTAAHFYDPTKAKFTDFLPFWEFISGPLNAANFGPNKADATFGLQVVYQKVPPRPLTSPLAGMQFFGQVDIDARSRAMTVTLKDLQGDALYSKTLPPA